MMEFRNYLYDIKTEYEYLLSRSKEITFEDFIENEEFKRAFLRSLEVIGEAAKKIPPNVRKREK